MHSENDLLHRYQSGLRAAERMMKRFYRTIIDGREAHDFAMDAIFDEPWMPVIVTRNIIDAYRREHGRKGCAKRRSWRGISPSSLIHRDKRRDHDWLDAYDLNETDRHTAEMIGSGMSKTEIARRMGVSQNAITNRLVKIGSRIHAASEGNLEAMRVIELYRRRSSPRFQRGSRACAHMPVLVPKELSEIARMMHEGFPTKEICRVTGISIGRCTRIEKRISKIECPTCKGDE
jgi:DNA-binding CsgD family transcriptional regulator